MDEKTTNNNFKWLKKGGLKIAEAFKTFNDKFSIRKGVDEPAEYKSGKLAQDVKNYKLTDDQSRYVLSRVLEGYVVWKASNENPAIFKRFRVNTAIPDVANAWGEVDKSTIKTIFKDVVKEFKYNGTIPTKFEEEFKKHGIKNFNFLGNIVDQIIGKKNDLDLNSKALGAYSIKEKDKLFNFSHDDNSHNFNADAFAHSLRKYVSKKYKNENLTTLLPLDRLFDLAISTHIISKEKVKKPEEDEKTTPSVPGSKEHLNKIYFPADDKINGVSPESMRKLKQGFCATYKEKPNKDKTKPSTVTTELSKHSPFMKTIFGKARQGWLGDILTGGHKKGTGKNNIYNSF